MNLTESEVRQIQERAEKATPAPWRAKWQTNVMAEGRSVALCGGHESSVKDTGPENEANAAFVAHSREDVPRLCESWLQQNKRIAELEAFLRKPVPESHRRTTNVEHRNGCNPECYRCQYEDERQNLLHSKE